MTEELLTIISDYLDHQGVEVNDEKLKAIVDELEEDVYNFIDMTLPQIVQENL